PGTDHAEPLVLREHQLDSVCMVQRLDPRDAVWTKPITRRRPPIPTEVAKCRFGLCPQEGESQNPGAAAEAEDEPPKGATLSAQRGRLRIVDIVFHQSPLLAADKQTAGASQALHPGRRSPDVLISHRQRCWCRE